MSIDHQKDRLLGPKHQALAKFPECYRRQGPLVHHESEVTTGAGGGNRIHAVAPAS